MKNELFIYAPVILAVITFAWNYKVFVTPAQLEERHRAIILEVENKYASKETVSALKEDMKEVKKKLSDIYDFLIKGDRKCK